MRQLVGARVELAVAQRAVLEHHRDRIRRARGLRGKQLRQRRAQRDRACAVVVPAPQDGVAAPPAPGCPAARSARSGVRNRRLQQPDQPIRQRLNARRDRTGRADSRAAAAAARPAARSGQRIMRGVVALRPRPSRSPPASRRKPGAVDRIVLEHHQRVEQLAQARPACWISASPRCWCAISRDWLSCDLPQQLRQRLAGGSLHPQRQRVDEQPHHALDAGDLRRPPRHRHAEHHVVAPGQPAEQDAPRPPGCRC